MSTPHAAAIAMFNNKLLDFVDDLRGIIGHVPEYKLIATSVKFLAQFQETQNQAVFDRYVAEPYSSFIRGRDEAFFLDEQYADVSGGVVALLKSVWTSIGDDDKDAVWAHLHVLLVLNDRCKAAA
jgi:hypothetical protein